MKRKIKFIVALVFLTTCNCMAQQPVAKKSFLTTQNTAAPFTKLLADTAAMLLASSRIQLNVRPSFYMTAPIAETQIPIDYYTRTFGYMCRKEWQFEKSTKIPLKVRLGSLEYCNRLEGK